MKKKILLMLIVIILIQIALPMVSVIWESGITIKSQAADTKEATVDGITWTYTLYNGNATDVKPKYKVSSTKEVTIPSTLNGYAVTSIGEDAFKYCSSLITIEIPEGVTSIERYAFKDCSNLGSVQIPSSVTSIGLGAFYGCSSLTSIEIPNGVRTIGNSAFEFCKSLERVEIPEGVTSIESYVFKDCSNLGSVQIPSSITNIGSAAFSNCSSLESIEIPNGVRIIGTSAFSTCTSLEKIEIPSSVQIIGNSIFSGVKLSIIINQNDNLISVPNIIKRAQDEEDILYSENIIMTNCNIDPTGDYLSIDIDKIKEGEYAIVEIKEGALSGVTLYITNGEWDISANGDKSVIAKLKSDRVMTISGQGTMKNYMHNEAPYYNIKNKIKIVNILEGVTSIGNYAFYNCSRLESIEIPSSVTSIGADAFYYCSSLESISIPEGVTRIGDYAFSRCNSLESISIPEGVTSIGNYTFYECSDLTIYCKENSVAQTYAKEKNIPYVIYEDAKGDVNGDKKVDFMDILAINKHRLGKTELKGLNLKVADVNEDGKVDFMDILQINKYRLGKIESL